MKQWLLVNPQQGYQAVLTAWRWLKEVLSLGQQYVLTIKPATRSTKQNRLLHARLQQVADELEWAGQHRSVDVWKRLLTAAWLRSVGEQIELLPAIDGHGFDIVFRHTSKLSVPECNDLITYIEAWMVDQGLTVVDEETGVITVAHREVAIANQ